MPPLTYSQQLRQSRGLPLRNSTGPATSPPVTLDPATSGNTGIGGGVDYARTTSFTGDAKDFLSSLYSARPRFVQQQGAMLQQLGPQLRQSIFQASPELAMASQHLQNTFNDPYGGQRSTFEDAIRGAQAARGFTGGGSGVVGEEARYLSNYTMQRRDQLLPQLQGFGDQILGISGLRAPTDVNFAGLSSAMLGSRNLQFQQDSAAQQAAYAEQLFKQYNQSLNQGTSQNPFQQQRGSTSTIVGGSPFGNGRSFSGQSGSGNAAGTYDASGNLVSSGNGTSYGGGVVRPPPTEDKAAKAKILQASGVINTEAEYLAYIGANNARSVTSSFNGVAI